MLAAGANAALAGRGAGEIELFAAQKHVLELHHPGVGEQQGGIVARYQRAGRPNRVAVLAKEFQKGGP